MSVVFFEGRRYRHNRDWIAGDSFHARGKDGVGQGGVSKEITGFGLYSKNSSVYGRAETQFRSNPLGHDECNTGMSQWIVEGMCRRKEGDVC